MAGPQSLYQTKSVELHDGSSPVSELEVPIAARAFVITERDVGCTMKIGDQHAPELDAAPGQYFIEAGAPVDEIGNIYVTAAGNAAQGNTLELILPRGFGASIIGDKFSGAVAEAAPSSLVLQQISENIAAGTSRDVVLSMPVPGFSRIFGQVSEADNQGTLTLEIFDENGTSLASGSDNFSSVGPASVDLSDADMDTVTMSIESSSGSGGLTQAVYLLNGYP